MKQKFVFFENLDSPVFLRRGIGNNNHGYGTANGAAAPIMRKNEDSHISLRGSSNHAVSTPLGFQQRVKQFQGALAQPCQIAAAIFDVQIKSTQQVLKTCPARLRKKTRVRPCLSATTPNHMAKRRPGMPSKNARQPNSSATTFWMAGSLHISSAGPPPPPLPCILKCRRQTMSSSSRV